MPTFSQFILFVTLVNFCNTYVVVVEPLERIEEEMSADPGAPVAVHPLLLRKRKSLLVGLAEHTEQVCKTIVQPNHRPRFGHISNGSRVEIQQDEESSLVATFVECRGENRPPCHGVDHELFISECVTVYEHKPANVRLYKSEGPYYPASVRIPIYCECRLRRHIPDFDKRK